MTAISRQIETLRANGMLGQMIRFGVSGLVSTLIYSAVYLPLTAFAFDRRHAVYAVPFGFTAAVIAGFFLHSRWSFKGHGTREPGQLQHVKFLAVQSTGMAVNAAITWVGTARLGYPGWVPLLPGIVVATALTFVLNRQLVFK